MITLKNVSIEMNSRTNNSFLIKNINLNLRKGDNVGLMGPNGSGKTSLLMAISGLMPISTGEIIYSSDDRSVSVIDYLSAINFELNAHDNLKLITKLYDPDRVCSEKFVDLVLHDAELKKDRSKILKQYSSGMIMRLIISLIFLINPRILIIDEWLSVLDSSFRNFVLNKLSSFKDSEKLLVIASHDRNFLEQICGKIVNLENGLIENIEKLG